MKLVLPAGTTSVICHVFIPDSTSTAGAGKTALVFGDITAYYVRAGGALTALTMVDQTTLGTWDADATSNKLAFKLLHDTNAPGLYELSLPDNILAVGATSVVVQLRATGAAPTMIEIQLAAPGDSSGVTTLLTRIVGTLLTGNHSPQSGDAYVVAGSIDGKVNTLGLICTTIDTLLDKLAPILVGTVTGAGTGTEVFVYAGVTVTVTVDSSGNRSVVAFT